MQRNSPESLINVRTERQTGGQIDVHTDVHTDRHTDWITIHFYKSMTEKITRQ